MHKSVPRIHPEGSAVKYVTLYFTPVAPDVLQQYAFPIDPMYKCLDKMTWSPQIYSEL